MMKTLRMLWKDEEGPTAVEYAIMLAVIAIVVIVGAKALGTATNTTFENVAGQVPGGG